MEMTFGILDGLQRAGMPGILQIAPTNVKLSDYETIAMIVKKVSEGYVVPTALHLDHVRRSKTFDRQSRLDLPQS